MSFGNTGQAKPPFGGCGVNAAPEAVGAETAQQNTASRSAFPFGSMPAPTPITFGQDTAPKPTGNPVNSENNMFGPINAASSSNTSATPTISVAQSLNSDNERFWCTACKKYASHLSQEFFSCSSCSQFYHRRCANMFVSTGIVQLVNYFGFDICQYCHFRLQYSTPAPFPITRPLCQMEANGIEEDERPMPRRSSRDPKEIPQSETPDQVAIIAEHFAIEPAPPFFNFSFDSVLDESDEPIIEALFELNDPVTLLALSQEHPDYKRPFKVVARHFNSREYPENNGDDGMDVSSDEKDTHTDNSVTNNLEGDTIDDLLGKIGWFYKLDRNPQSDIAMLPNLVLWHEDDLGLALDDDSGDEDDLDLDDSMEEDIIGEVIAQEVVVKTIVKEEVIEETIVEDIVVTDSNSNA